MYLKSQNEAAVENSRRVPTKDEARKWYADIKPIILCTDQGDITLRSGTQKLLVVGLFEPGCPKRSGMYLKSQSGTQPSFKA